MKRLIPLFSLVLLSYACSNETGQLSVESKPAIDQTKFETLYRSGKSIQGAMAVGVTYQGFGELLQSLATEISIAADKATSIKEKELVGAYTEALMTYKDSHSLWRLKVEHSLDYFPYGWGTVADSLAKKYNIPIEGSGETRTLDDNALQIIWGAAGKQLENANKLYYSR